MQVMNIGILSDVARSTEDTSQKVVEITRGYPFEKQNWKISREETSIVQKTVKAKIFLWTLETRHI